jgi:hypothetical protein
VTCIELSNDEAGDGVLYRALRDDVPFRFARIGGTGGSEYDVVHEDGDVDAPGGVMLIDVFDVPPEEDEAFLDAWRAGRAPAQGYLGARLFRSDAAASRFVEVARWSSPLMVARAGRSASAVLYLRPTR